MTPQRKVPLPTVGAEPLPSPSAIEYAAAALGAPDRLVTVRELTRIVCLHTGVQVTDRQRLHVSQQLHRWRSAGHASEHTREQPVKGSTGGRPATRWHIRVPILEP